LLCNQFVAHAIVKIQTTEALCLGFEFNRCIIEPLYKDLTEFEENLDYFKEDKIVNNIGSMSLRKHVHVIDPDMHELF